MTSLILVGFQIYIEKESGEKRGTSEAFKCSYHITPGLEVDALFIIDVR
jgi:hypothetical protein